MLPFVEFAYDNSKNRTTQLSPLEVVCWQNPSIALDLVPIPNMKKVYTKTEEMVEQIIEGIKQLLIITVTRFFSKEEILYGLSLIKDRFLS